MKVNFSHNSDTSSAKEARKMKRKHSKLTWFFAGFTFLSLIWIGLVSDTFSQAAQVEPKDYAAEESRNRELANQSKEVTAYDKLKDENAVQYVNDAVADEMEDVMDMVEESVTLPEEPEEDPDGEEF